MFYWNMNLIVCGFNVHFLPLYKWLARWNLCLESQGLRTAFTHLSVLALASEGAGPSDWCLKYQGIYSPLSAISPQSARVWCSCHSRIIVEQLLCCGAGKRVLKPSDHPEDGGSCTGLTSTAVVLCCVQPCHCLLLFVCLSSVST